MSWVETTFEIAMKDHIIDKLGSTKGEELYNRYVGIRNSMEDDNFLPEIKGQEPNLSDHSEKHIQDVLERTYKVVGKKGFKEFDAYEVYCLALMILFHDVGNIFGRKGHAAEEKIAEVYNSYRAKPENFRSEKRVIMKGASAHSGSAKDGTKDTLKYVKSDNIEGNSINLLELAAILRFSDELSEGKQRTCSFLLDKGLYDEKSLVYQHYAQVTTIHIDRGGERISITYDINIPKDFDSNAENDLTELLAFSYYRAIKLDVERRYTKHYSEIIKKFKKVSIVYNFNIDEIPLNIDLNPIILEDRFPIPDIEFDEKTATKFIESVVKFDSNYDPKKLVNLIKSKL
jgi:hypothetical protein